jgi:hypothetical protein
MFAYNIFKFQIMALSSGIVEMSLLRGLYLMGHEIESLKGLRRQG